MEDFERLFNVIWQRRWPFLSVFFVVVTLSYAILFVVDFIPEPVSEVSDETATAATVEADPNFIVAGTASLEVESENIPNPTDTAATVVVPDSAAVPVAIIFDSLDRTVPVNNPTSRSIAALDEALLTGAVRHPDSADFQDPGNIFILGHSSYLPNVFNKNFQAFNGIQNLDWGDIIRLQSEGREYVYRIDRVYEAKASEVVVPNSRGESKLTLATCDSFGSKDDRFVVEATLIESYRL